MKRNTIILKEHNSSEKDLPPIRKTRKEAPNSSKVVQNIKSLEYDKWDKYDAGMVNFYLNIEFLMLK